MRNMARIFDIVSGPGGTGFVLTGARNTICNNRKVTRLTNLAFVNGGIQIIINGSQTVSTEHRNTSRIGDQTNRMSLICTGSKDTFLT